MSISCTYKITFTNSLKYYIGSSKDLDDRKKKHLYFLSTNAHCNTHLQHIYNKYTKDVFIFNILEHVEQENLFTEEQKLLDKAKGDPNCINQTFVAGGGKLYVKNASHIAKEIATKKKNGTYGKFDPIKLAKAQALAVKANTGLKRTKEARKKMSDSKMEFHKNNPGAYNKSLEKGRISRWQKQCKPFYLVKDTHKTGPFNKQMDACQTNILSSVSIHRLYQGKLKSVKGYTLEFVNSTPTSA